MSDPLLISAHILSADECYCKNDYTASLAHYIEAAHHGSAEAMDELGDCYYCGIMVEKDINKAVEWYKLAAKLGNESAIKSLAEINQLSL